MPKIIVGGFDFRRGTNNRPLRVSKAAPARHRSEHQEQAAFFDWCRLWPPNHILRRFRAVPNGGWRHSQVAAALKREGVLPGVYDTYLPAARRGFHSLALEFKVGKNDLTPEQRAEREFLLSEGNCAHTVWTWTEAARICVWYLELEPLYLPLRKLDVLLENGHNARCGCEVKV
jgi:hypothetical protein